GILALVLLVEGQATVRVSGVGMLLAQGLAADLQGLAIALLGLGMLTLGLLVPGQIAVRVGGDGMLLAQGLAEDLQALESDLPGLAPGWLAGSTGHTAAAPGAPDGPVAAGVAERSVH